MLGSQGLWAERYLYCGASVFPVSSKGTPHFFASYDTHRDCIDDETKVLCQSTLAAQKSRLPSIGLILQPFIGNGDMSIWVKYYQAGRKCNQPINLTNSAKFWWRVLSCKNCYCNWRAKAKEVKNSWAGRTCKIVDNQSIRLIDFIRFYVPLKNFSFVWRRHHYRWRAAKFRPMFGAQGLWAGRDLYRGTPAMTRDLGFSELSHFVASYDIHEGMWRIYSNPDPHRINQSEVRITDL
jgi:hypothetical protein